ncbi:MAG: PSD1 and planctomycete cytochrome C domain-containing protein [Pirellulaceae bacterium]
MMRLCSPQVTTWLAALAISLGGTLTWAAENEEKIDFQRQIRPLLADKCFACHGRDAKHREGSLRLDERAGALTGGDSGEPAIVDGQPEKSELVRRILATEASERMPPPESKKSLTADEKELLRRWIAAGAEYEDHWAFAAPVRPVLPTVKNQAWPKNDIDRFVLARLERERLAPSPAADDLTLLRRLTLDLTGLPPTVAEIDAFQASGERAIPAAIDRLLASPHYGERWGRIWLDGARYADSDGYEKDKPRFVWSYRDWVVGALNRDLPYNQFVVEQIAGDLLPNATQDQIVATGFLRNSMINEEGGVDPEQFRMEAMFDRMDALGKSMLGLTIQCCQCHDHKYDPFTQEDYYRVFAFLNDTHEANVAVYPPDQLMQRADLLRQIGELETGLQHQSPDWQEQMAAWEDSIRGNQPEWTVVSPEPEVSGGQKHYVLDDGSILAQGYAPTKHTTEFVVTTTAENITAVQLEMLNDPNLPLGGPGRSILGTCALSEFRLEAGPADGSGKMEEVKLSGATADVNPAEKELDAIFADKSKKRRVTGPIEYALDQKDETAWGIDIGPGRSNVPRKAVFTLEKPLSLSGGAKLKFRLTQNHGGWNSDDNQNNNLGRFRLSVTTAGQAQADPVPAGVRKVLDSPKDQRSPAQIAAVFSYWRTTVPEWSAVNAQIEALWKQHPPGTSQYTLAARDEPRKTHLLDRGDFLKPTKEVRPGTPGFLHSLSAENPTRLDFARWLVDERSPTAARSIVNRVWQAYFGIGLVGTSEDLGMQGEAPSHPELLDWLVVQFMQDGWSLKKLHKLIASSATYQQSSRIPAELLARDPDNRLLARGPRFRVGAEAVRDIALTASGLLNPKLAGPPVYPPAPDFLFVPPASYGPKVWNEAQGDDRYRRAIYTFRFRSVPYPVLEVFDAPNGEVSCVRRTRSNTPLQALASLNEPLFLECARALAMRVLTEGGATDGQRLAHAFRCCTARVPDEIESTALLSLLSKQTERFAQPDAKPWDLAANDPANDPANPPPLPDGATPAQLAAWTAVSRVLLNLDETITKE